MSMSLCECTRLCVCICSRPVPPSLWLCFLLLSQTSRWQTHSLTLSLPLSLCLSLAHKHAPLSPSLSLSVSRPLTPSLLGSQTHSHKHARLIVIQQSHQLLGLVYETPVQLATKLSARIAIHSGHWSHTLFFFPFGCFVLNEGCISLHQLADTVAGWTTNPTPHPLPSCEGSADVRGATKRTTNHISSDLLALRFLIGKCWDWFGC